MSREHGRRSIGAVGVVLPVNDEEKLLPAALQAIEVAVDALSTSISTQVVVVLDCCGDASSAIAHRWGARFGALVIQRQRWSGAQSWESRASVTLGGEGPRADLAGDNRR